MPLFALGLNHTTAPLAVREQVAFQLETLGQALRDLTDASSATIAAERNRVANEGLGSQILASQQPDGSWRRNGVPAWLSTLFTMQLLRATGVDPAAPAVQTAATRLETGLRWNDEGGRWDLRPPETGGNTFFQGEVEPCINGGVLATGAYLCRPVEGLARRLVGSRQHAAARPAVARPRRTLLAADRARGHEPSLRTDDRSNHDSPRGQMTSAGFGSATAGDDLPE